jgi:hypothetical protein
MKWRIKGMEEKSIEDKIKDQVQNESAYSL